MAQTVVQTSSEMVVSSGATGHMDLTGVASGNLLLTLLTQETDGTTFATNSDGTNTWTKDPEKANLANGVACIQSAKNVASGNPSVVATLTGGVSKTYRGRLLEVSGSATTAVDASDGIIGESDGGTGNHICSSAGITPSAGCIVVTSSAFGSSVGVTTAGSGYTKITTSGLFTHWQYQIFPSAPTAEKGAWSAATVSRNTNAVIAAYKAAAVASSKILLRRRREMAL